MSVMTETMPIINIRRNIPINYKIENINFSNENKKKIINLLKKNESNVFTNENVNNLIKLVSNENKIKIKNLLNKANKLKYNNLSENNKKIIDELLKIKKIFENFKSRGFYDNNQNNTRESILSNNNRVNISNILPEKIKKMLSIINKYINVLDPNIKDIFQNIIRKNIQNNIIPESKNMERILSIITTFTYQESTTQRLNLIPEIYDHNNPGNIMMYESSMFAQGSFGKVYKNLMLCNSITGKYECKNIPYIFKLINDKTNLEFKSLIFNICLLVLLYFQSGNKIKYFCNLYEFGKIKNNNKVYAIMENGGNELSKIISKYVILSKERLLDILVIIKECAKAIQILHNIDIIHCDIKLENFLYSEKDNNKYCIKIIDFGFIKKNKTIVNNLFGTPDYIPYDFYSSRYKEQKYTITIKNDIYALGIMLLKLLLNNNNNIIKNLKNYIYLNDDIKNIINIIIDNLKKIFKIGIIGSLFMKKNIMYQLKIDFIQKLNTILRKITYLEGNYNNLQEFIDDIDNLIRLLNEIK